MTMAPLKSNPAVVSITMFSSESKANPAGAAARVESPDPTMSTLGLQTLHLAAVTKAPQAVFGITTEPSPSLRL